MQDAELRKLNMYCRNQLKRVSISEQEVAVVMYIKNRGATTSSELADWLKVSKVHSCTVLSRLWEKKYLNREQTGCPTGGRQYTYQCGV